jgi:hypothetical protein
MKLEKYFDEVSNEPIETIMQGLSREIEVTIHVKIRELVGCERIRKNCTK